MAKLTPREKVHNSLRTAAESQKTIDSTTILLTQDMVKNSPELKATLSATLRMATENRDSAIGSVFYQIKDSVGTDLSNLEKFVKKIFPNEVVESEKGYTEQVQSGNLLADQAENMPTSLKLSTEKK